MVFFNQAWRAKQLPVGTLALFFGTVGSYRGALQLASPTSRSCAAADDGEPSRTRTARRGRVYPVYPLTEKAKLTSARIGRLVGEALDRAGDFADPVSGAVAGPVRARRPHHGLQRHPPARADGRAAEPARRRLAFDELFRLQLALVLRRQAGSSDDARGIRHVVSGPRTGPRRWWSHFVDRLPFPLTGAQRRAMATIRTDLAGPLPMHRLLQGDVGLGQDGGGGGRPAGRRWRAATRAR